MCKLTCNSKPTGRAPALGRFQAGATLIEIMIGLALSLVVVTSMVALMGNSMGSATRIIQMTQLSDELRNAMSMMTRDLRRSNYSANSAYCYANSDCGVDGSATQVGDITISGGNCMIFNLDRDQDGDASDDGAGGFRLRDDGGVGFIEMWTGDASPGCNDGAGGDWIALTDPAYVNITVFSIDDSNSIENSITVEGGGTLTQRTRQIVIQIQGELLIEDTITRRLEDTIKVRNDWLN